MQPVVAPLPMQSVDRALETLELLAKHGESGVAELAERLGVHKSTALRLLGALETRRMVERIGDRGRYRLGGGVQVIDLRPEGDRREDVVVDLRDMSLRPSGSVSARREVAADLGLKPQRRAADGQMVSQGDVERQPLVDQGFSVSLTDKDLVRRRDEIIARTQAEIDELESRSAHG